MALCAACAKLTALPALPPSPTAADGTHAFATCMLSYGFMGDVMAESENYRWLGPLRYDVVSKGHRPSVCLAGQGHAVHHGHASLLLREEMHIGAKLAGRSSCTFSATSSHHLSGVWSIASHTDWRQDAGSQPLLPRAAVLPACRGGAAGGGGQGEAPVAGSVVPIISGVAPLSLSAGGCG